MFNFAQFNSTQPNSESAGVKARTRKGREPKIAANQRREKPRIAA